MDLRSSLRFDSIERGIEREQTNRQKKHRHRLVTDSVYRQSILKKEEQLRQLKDLQNGEGLFAPNTNPTIQSAYVNFCSY